MKLGILGAGMIVEEFLSMSSQLKEITLSGITVTERKYERALEWKERYHIQMVYRDYLEMLQSDVQVIYIAVPNHLHVHMAELALDHGKHVILEKPFTPCDKETKRIFEKANLMNCYVFEAITTLHLPSYHQLKSLIGELGDLKVITCNFSQFSSRYEAFKQGNILPAFDPKFYGGALMDINVYNIHYAVGLFGKPLDIQYYPTLSQGIDTSGVLRMVYDGFQCICIGAKDCSAPILYTIQGDKGYLSHATPANNIGAVTLACNQKEPKTYDNAAPKHRMVYEFERFSQIIKEGDVKAYQELVEHTITVSECLTKARESL